MKNRKLFGIISTLMLAGLLVLTACGFDGGGENSALQEKITEAEMEYDATFASSNGNDVPLGTYWVTYIEKAAFLGAINAAKTALDASSQADIDKATATLISQIEQFKTIKQPGTANPVNKIALAAKIAEAKLEKSKVVVVTSTANAAYGRKYVFQQTMDIFETAIDAAVKALNTNKQAVVDSAETALTSAITAFKNAQGTGTNSSGFTSAELAVLLADAYSARAVQISANGDDVSPAGYWTSEGAFTVFNNVIINAQNASGVNIDTAYLNLVSAINTFNNAKQLGSTPDKEVLFDAIKLANTIKTGVVVAESADQAPGGSKWAKTAQWTPFNTAYNNALNAAVGYSAAKTQVASLKDALTTATVTFNSAVTGNGPGSKRNTITIRDLSPYNGEEISIRLFESVNNINVNWPVIYGHGEIQNGAVTIALSNYSNNTPWSGNGLWYVVLLIEADNYISKSPVDFTNNSNPVTSFYNYIEY
jgi:hypothetical protein